MVNRKAVAILVKPFRKSQVVVVGDGVFFHSKKSAQIAAKKYKRQLIQINEAGVVGWLVLDKPESD